MINLLSAPLDPIPRPVKRKRPSSTKRVNSKKGATPAKKKPTPKTPKAKKTKGAAKSTVASSLQNSSQLDSRSTPACAERSSPTTTHAEAMEVSEKLAAYDNIGDLFRPHYRNGLHLSGMPAAATVLPATTDDISPLNSLHNKDGKMIKRILIQNIQVLHFTHFIFQSLNRKLTILI